MDVNIRIAGEAGQGLVTIGDALLGAMAGMGLYVFSTPSYMSRIRGGLNWYDIRVSDVELFSRRESADILVAFTDEALDALRGYVAEDGLILSDAGERPGTVAMGLSAAAQELSGAKVMANSVAGGAVFALLGYDVEHLCRHMKSAFGSAPEDVVQQNVNCARRGAEMAQSRAGSIAAPQPVGAPPTLYSGAETVALGAATAGVKFAAGYPMTPATGTLTYLAQAEDEYGMVVEQAEDEIAAINMVCGAAYAGVPAMTTTSGGGFALMCEGMSLAGMLELPVFVVLAQRPGPATGMPTRTAQQDLKLAINGGHGEFPRLVFAPGTPGQAYELARRAVELAHKHQSPAILLSDQFLADCQRNQPPLDRALRPVDRFVLADPPVSYQRYQVTASGVSPRAVPGSGTFVVCDSDEHDESGHLSEDFDARTRLQDKRMRKENGLLDDFLPPEYYGPEDPQQILLAWGSTYMPCREAVDILKGQNRSVGMVHFAQVWPIRADLARSALRIDNGGNGPPITSVEANATGQFASVLRDVGVVTQCRLMLRYDGLSFSADEIATRCNA
jgi:2-oxoglutarate ferredoxin oxidoreductase subunit alpha